MDEQTAKRKGRRRRRRRNKALRIVASVALVLALLGLIAFLIFGNENDRQASDAQFSDTPSVTATATLAAQLQVDPNAGELITPVPAPTEPGVAVPGWGSMTIPAGVTEVATSMQNPEANEGWYYLTFELRFKDTDEVIFTTGLIPPGQYCNKVTLTRPLEKGEYAAVVHVQPYRISDMSPTNNADMETLLIVE